MKKTLLIAAALACSGAVAQEKEIWACQQIEGTMLMWENSRWRSVGLAPLPLLLTLDGENSSFKIADTIFPLDCSKAPLSGSGMGDVLSCLSKIKTQHILINLNSGKMGMTSLIGAIASGDTRDSIDAEAFNCTKF